MTADLTPLQEHIQMTRAAREPKPVAAVPDAPPAQETPAPGERVLTPGEVAFGERLAIAGSMGASILNDLHSRGGDTIWIDGGEFTFLDIEELAAFGIEEDDEPYGPVYLKRLSDGAVFEVEVECDVRRLEPVKAKAGAA